MTVVSDVVAETGIDLKDPKLTSDTLAPLLADRLTTAFPAFGDAQQAVTAIMTAYKGLTGSPTVLGAVGIAISAVGAAAGFLEGRLDKDIAGNRKRWEDARNKTIARWVKPGDWSTAVYANGLPVGDVDLKNNIGGWDESDFLAQYNEGMIWMSHRTAKSDVLIPTWESPPFTNGFGFMSADKGIQYPLWSPLTGFSVTKRLHRLGQPWVGPIPAKYDSTYFGTLPSLVPQDLADAGLEGAPKFLQRLIVKMEEAFYNQAFIPPPDYTYLFSVGTYPYTSWSTANNGMPGATGSLTLNASMAAIAAAIHSLSPMHALVRSAEVAKCYRAWLNATRIRQLPKLPKGQVEAGCYLDEQGLPWGPTPLDGFICVTELTPEQKKWVPEYQWEKDNEKRCNADPTLANMVGSGCYPEGLGGSYRIGWKAAREIEQAFRSFFAIRRAALYQMDLTTNSFRTAAAASPDPEIAAAAKGKPPPYKPWNAMDPLNDGWTKKGYGETATKAGPAPKVEKLKPGPGKLAPTAAPLPQTDRAALLAIGLTGAAGVATLGYANRVQLREWSRRIVARIRGSR